MAENKLKSELDKKLDRLEKKRKKEIEKLENMIEDDDVDGKTCDEAIRRHLELVQEIEATLKENPDYQGIDLEECYGRLMVCKYDRKMVSYLREKREKEDKEAGIVRFKSPLDREIEELEKEEDKAFKVLKKLTYAEEFDGGACAEAIIHYCEISNKLTKARQSHPDYKGPKESGDFFELASKLLDQKVVPYFCDEEDEAWQHVDLTKLTNE